MGKAADNERIKLKATFYNNMAIALAVGGFFLPYLAYAPKAIGTWVEIVAWWRQGGPPPQINYYVAAATILLMLMILYFAKRLRRKADEEIQKLTGD
jgi:hypothetical protein